MALSDKQRAFIDHYLVVWNASEAARRAGYSLNTAGQIGYENLKKPEIQEAIAVRMADLAMSANEVLARMTAIARASIADALTLPPIEAPEGKNVGPAAWDVDLVKAQQTGAIHLVKKIKSGKYGTEIEMYDAHAALVKLGEHFQLWGKAPDLLKYVDLSKLSPEQLQRIADGEDPIAVLLTQPDPA